MEQLRLLNDLAAAHGMELAHLAIRWTLRSSAVTSSLVGARNVGQLNDILESLDAPELDAGLLEAIDAISPV
jgi:L-glyceraldehyde 3-phosphate reductase